MSKRRALRLLKGQGGIYKDPKSRYLYISYWNGWRQIRESARTEDRDEALATLQRKLGDVATGKGAGPERIRISALLRLFIEEYRVRDKGDLYQAELRVNKHLIPALGSLRAVELSSAKIKAYIEQRKLAKAANGTINRELAHLRRAFRLGYEHDPQLVYRLPILKALKENNIREGFLDQDAYFLIRDALPDDLKALFVVAYHLGMRSSELLNLRRDWVDLSEGLIYVQGRVTKTGAPKTAPIYDDMGPWLEMALTGGNAAWPTSPWLFTWTASGQQIRDFRGSWRSACTKADVPGLLFHDLRRTAVRNMIRAGVPEKTAMQISGHKTAAMLWRYNILDTRDIKDAGRKTEMYLQRQRGSNHAEVVAEPSSRKPS
jgi:integrase